MSRHIRLRSLLLLVATIAAWINVPVQEFRGKFVEIGHTVRFDGEMPTLAALVLATTLSKITSWESRKFRETAST